MKNLNDIFFEHKDRLIDKWDHYLDIYEENFSEFVNKKPKVLEIGVYHGGSLQMWKRYFGEGCNIVGLDINHECKKYEEDGISIVIGDQSSPDFWASFFESHGEFDIIIDDGSHINSHQIITFLSAWPHLKNNGVYLVEDLHCAYWREYGGGYRNPANFLEFSKQLIDEQNAYWSRDPGSFPVSGITNQLRTVSYNDSMVVFKKKIRTGAPVRYCVGNPSRPLSAAEEEVVAAAKRRVSDLLTNQK